MFFLAENLGTGEIFSDVSLYLIYIFFGGNFSTPKNKIREHLFSAKKQLMAQNSPNGIDLKASEAVQA